MQHKQEVTKFGLILALSFLVGAIAVAAPVPAVAGCAAGDPQTGTGTVLTCCDGQGFVVKMDGTGEEVKLVGLGPVWFWDANKYDRPDAGDQVTVSWYAVTCKDVEQNVLASIDYVGKDEDGLKALELRYVLDGNIVLLWKVAERQIARQQQLAHQHRTSQVE